MAAQRKKYTAEFKRDAVSLITDHGYGVSEAARNVGLHATMLRQGKRTLAQEGAQAFPGNGRLRPAQEALPRLRHADTRLRLAREILQQAALFFATEVRGGTRLSRRGTRSGPGQSYARGCRCAAVGFLPPRVAKRPGRLIGPRWSACPGCKPLPGQHGRVMAAVAWPHNSKTRGGQWGARKLDA
jgi:transposase